MKFEYAPEAIQIYLQAQLAHLCNMHRLTCLVCISLALTGMTYGWWPFSSSSEDNVLEEEEARATPAGLVQFEMKSAEQKFLAEAQQLLDLSPLERCQNEVIHRLRKSCGEIDEEELGKLSVALLNCQSQTEGRQTFRCTDYMTLAECTSPMDPTVWNAYHIISNRARSVCYATRQQQFRRQTEVAVNTLSRSTLDQLRAMEELHSSHQEIRGIAQESLDTMNKHQDSLLEQQRALLTNHRGMHDRIADNLEQLANEKALIHTGQEQLANMTKSIWQQLDEASEQLEKQEESRKEGHKEILTDITVVRGNIQEVWERLDNSSTQLLGMLEEISLQYQATLDNLHLINSSVTSMLSLINGMNTAVNSQLDWLVGQLGGAKDGLRVLTACATHACFLLIAILCVLFIKAPAFARFTLLVLVVGNVLAEVRFQSSFSLYTLCALEAAIIIVNWLYFCLPKKPISVQQHGLNPPSQQPLPLQFHSATINSAPDVESDIDDFEDSTEPSLYTRNTISSSREAETLSYTPTKLTTAMPVTPLKPPPSHSLSHSTPRQRQCLGITRTGLQCRLPATPGSTRCYRHGQH